jgi:hypothetical protein
MHTYWKAMQPDLFPQETTDEEVRNYGTAIEHGYRSADELLRRMMELLDSNTVLVVASSMGQKPFITSLKKGKRVGQLRSLDRLIDILELQGKIRALATMSDQFNLYAEKPSLKDEAFEKLKNVYIDSPERPMFNLDSVGDSITVTLKHYDETDEDSRCFFPYRKEDNSYRFEDLVYGTGMVKSGCHDPKGMMILYGRGIRRNAQISDCTNLDVAPTLLNLLGLPIPAEMSGRVLCEAMD